MTFHTRQNGNALFVVLIAVVLFAALSFAIMHSGTGSASPRDKYEVQYGDILSGMNAIAAEFNKLILNGCSIASIDVAWQPLADEPLDAGQDTSCILFNTRGGNAPVTLGATGQPLYWISLWDIKNVGAAGRQDVIVVVDMQEARLDYPNFCEYVNVRYGLGMPETQAFAINRTSNHLNYPDSAPFGFTAAYDGKTTACFFSSADARHLVYSVAMEQ